MAFEALSEKLSNVFKSLRSKGKLSDADIQSAMREVKLALLEADVNFKVVKDFIASVSERAKGEEVMQSLTPAQMVIKIVFDEMTNLMGEESSGLKLSGTPPYVIMLAGLQGSGKTTTSAKLATNLRKQGKSPLLVACDVYRPAAILQLQTLGKQLDIPVFSIDNEKNVPEIVRKSVDFAKMKSHDILVLDTAGRLNIDETLMQELRSIKNSITISETLLVIDAMIGQESVDIAKSFNEQLEIDGIVVTKLDGDTRGGVALSVKSVVGKPIKFVGMGEKISDLNVFHPERMAQRILGMGDVLSLIDKAQETFNEKEALEMHQKLIHQKFTLDDFLSQLEQLQKMGPMNQLIEMLPGMNKKQLGGLDFDDKKLTKTKAIIQSMTLKERENPNMINGSRRSRIALGSGTRVQDVNNLLNQFEQMKKMIKKMSNNKFNKFSILGGAKPW